jgi:phage tail sheath protein FI
MPEYRAPGVYVGETSFRARSIEGVDTETAGFVGQCRSGPVRGVPRLITSFTEFERHFGGLDDLVLGGVSTTNYLAHSVQLFFANGGRKLFISRVFRSGDADAVADCQARGPDMVDATVRFRARFPGLAGNLLVSIDGFRSENLLATSNGSRSLRGLLPGDVVEAVNGEPRPKMAIGQNADAIDPNMVYFVLSDGQGNLQLVSASNIRLGWENDTALQAVQRISLTVRVQTHPDDNSSHEGRVDTYQDLSCHPDSPVFVGTVLRHGDPDNRVEPPDDRAARVFLQFDGDPPTQVQQKNALAAQLLESLGMNSQQLLAGGSDGEECTPGEYPGGGSGHIATGLAALSEVEEIAIVAAPGSSGIQDEDQQRTIRQLLIDHCESLRYRFAILSGKEDLDSQGILDVRRELDSKYAAIYFPWLIICDPFSINGNTHDTISVPPDGAVAGIYARSNVERGVHKAPANEVVRGNLRFSRDVNKGTQDVLNPGGVNCLRFFEGRGYRVWGARTISSDPEWKYLNVRRLFIFLEHSIDRWTQWVVFEPNGEQLWSRVRLSIESFLTRIWRDGALMGSKPEDAFFVRCDRSTMTQDDLDNGRLVCEIGVAPMKPAEFVIFRIGQWTADASIDQ